MSGNSDETPAPIHDVHLETNGPFYSTLKAHERYDDEYSRCIENTVRRLLQSDTSASKPGMLLGKVQSGKTKTFMGIMGLAFDNGYDVAIVLTKSSTPLTDQTCKRLESAFGVFIDEQRLQVFDILAMPPLSGYELRQKLVIVAKKETRNLQRLATALFRRHPDLASRRVLIVDDEADYASVGFKQTSNAVKMNVIAHKIDELRAKLTRCDFLQVTATPYSLYLQPDSDSATGATWEFMPIRPAFTELVPEYEGYVGGNFYFGGTSADSPAAHLLHVVSTKELEVLHHEDRRRFKLEDALTSKQVSGLRTAVVNFLVGASIRRVQNQDAPPRERHYSFIIHIERTTSAHSWQERIVRKIVELLQAGARDDSDLFASLMREAYSDMQRSCSPNPLPPFEAVVQEARQALLQDWLLVTVVNSKSQTDSLLDKKGQLKLRAPMNIFVGGQVLDRGITVAQLIGFYYGRRANRIQQDTVLQHSRMYGYRPSADLAVTRFYTTREIHEVLRTINEFDEALRDAFRRKAQERGVVFIRRDERNRITPCSPNKILRSMVTTLRPSRRLLPVGFQTKPKYQTERITRRIDAELRRFIADGPRPEHAVMPVEAARKIIEWIAETLVFEDGFSWDHEAFLAALEYLTKVAPVPSEQEKLLCLVRRGRDVRRIMRTTGAYYDAPDTGHVEGAIAKQVAMTMPMLMLFRLNGKKEDGWGGCPFWWPVLHAPSKAKPVVFTSGTSESA